jgi:hypothetical protein
LTELSWGDQFAMELYEALQQLSLRRLMNLDQIMLH